MNFFRAFKPDHFVNLPEYLEAKRRKQAVDIEKLGREMEAQIERIKSEQEAERVKAKLPITQSYTGEYSTWTASFANCLSWTGAK